MTNLQGPISADRRATALATTALIVMVTVWGSMFPALERLLATWDVISATAGRHFLAVATLLLVLTIRERRFPLRRQLPWPKLMLLGLVGMSLTAILTTASVYMSNGVAAAIAAATNPITAAITARFLSRIPLKYSLVAGALVSTFGGIVTVLGGGPTEFRGGELLVIASNVVWTWYSVRAQQWLQGYSQLHITALTAVPGLLGLLAVLGIVAASGVGDLRVDLSVEPVILILFLGIVSVALGNFLWHYGVSRVGVTIASLYGNLIPVVAVIASVLAGTTPTLAQLLGGAIIIAGVLYAQLMGLRRTDPQAARAEL